MVHVANPTRRIGADPSRAVVNGRGRLSACELTGPAPSATTEGIRKRGQQAFDSGKRM